MTRTLSKTALAASLGGALLLSPGAIAQPPAPESRPAQPQATFIVTENLRAKTPGHTDVRLAEVANFGDQQATGVTVSADGRVFVNFPRWHESVPISLAEVGKDGSVTPYPDESWNSWKQGDDPKNKFVCVQSVVAGPDGKTLWALDPAAPMMVGVVEGGAKLVEIELGSNTVKRSIVFDNETAPRASYLNDVRFAPDGSYAYITESGLGSLVVVNLETGKARRVLASHPSTTAEKVTFQVEGKKVLNENNEPPQIHADGIALSKDGETLYYHALTGHTLYSIPTAALRDESLKDEDLAAQVKNLGKTDVTDGMIVTPDGYVLHTALEYNAITAWHPEGTAQPGQLVRDTRLSWPDTLAWGPNGDLYITASQIHKMERFNNGKSTRTEPYRLFKWSATPDPNRTSGPPRGARQESPSAPTGSPALPARP